MYRYSDRLAALTSPENSFSGLLTKLREAGRPLLDLTISNPTLAFAEYPHREISKALAGISDFSYRADPFGSQECRTSIVRLLQRRFPGIDVSPENVALTASTSEAYAMLFKLLANPGDEILVPTPSYPLFDYLAQLEGINLRQYRLQYDGSWSIDFDSLLAATSERSRALILVNPNNPTGSFLQTEEWGRLSDFVLARGLPLISDEVFIDYEFAESTRRVKTLNGRHENLSFTLNGLSKACGMPQMKLGWIAVNGPLNQRMQACSRLELILDTYLSVSAPVQLAIDPLMRIGGGIRDLIQLRLQRNLFALDAALPGSPAHRLGSEGGWSAILRVPNVFSEDEWITRFLSEQNIIVQPGYFFDMQGGTFLVVSLLTPEDTFDEGIRRMMRSIQS